MSMLKLFPVTEVPENARKLVDVGDHKVLVIHAKGKFYAVDNHCPHMNLPMQSGKITDDCAIVCPFHRSAFDLESGDVKEWSPWPPLVGKALGALGPADLQDRNQRGCFVDFQRATSRALITKFKLKCSGIFFPEHFA